jgi:type II secretory pathway component GspD/PulD (secretin)
MHFARDGSSVPVTQSVQSVDDWENSASQQAWKRGGYDVPVQIDLGSAPADPVASVTPIPSDRTSRDEPDAKSNRPVIKLLGQVQSLNGEGESAFEAKRSSHGSDIVPFGTVDQSPQARKVAYRGDEPAARPALPAAPDASSVQDGLVTFNFKDAPWPAALKEIAAEAGFALELKATPPGSFTYHDSVPRTLADSIDIVNAVLIRDGFVLLRFKDIMVVHPTSTPIPPHLIEQVPLEQLSNRGNYELVTVRLQLRNLSPALSASQVSSLLTPLGRATPVDISRTLLITDLRQHLERAVRLVLLADGDAGQPSHEVIKLKNVQATKVVESIQQMLKAAEGSRANDPSTGSAIRNMHDIVAIEETNSVIISASPSELAKLKRLIMQIDASPSQVYIKALLVEVELGKQDEFGVEIGVQDSLLFQRSVVEDILTTTQTQTSPNGAQTTSENIISSQTSPGFNFNNQPIGNNTAANPARLAGQALSNLAVGRVNADVGYGGFVLAGGSDSISLLLRALAAERKVTVLSRPNIRTVDNRPATIQMGAQVPVVDGVSVSANGNANPVVRQDKSGIILEVTPKLSEGGSIFMEVRAEKSAFRSGPGSGTPIFLDATSGNVIESPIKDVVEASATIAMNSGQTICLGGMITTEEAEIRRKVPLAGDLPLVGKLFRYDRDTVQRKELLIFLTPQLLDHDSTHVDSSELMRSSADVGKMLEFYHGRPLPLQPGYAGDAETSYDEAERSRFPMSLLPKNRSSRAEAEPHQMFPDRQTRIEEFLTPQ